MTPVLQQKGNLTAISFTSLSFSRASGLKSGTIALPCWRYLIGKPLSRCAREGRWGVAVRTCVRACQREIAAG